MSLQVLSTRDENEWMDVLIHSLEYDFYHLPQYHALAEERGEGKAHLFVYREGAYSVAVPLLLRSIATALCHARTGEGWWDATSVYGYAGPVASHSDVPESVMRGFRSALREALMERRVAFAFSRLHPLMSQTELLTSLGRCTPVGRTVSIDLTVPAETQRRHYRKDYRRQINKLKRIGVLCLHDESKAHLSEFIEIYRETMHRIGACGAYLFDDAYFERLNALLGSNLHLFVCLLENRSMSGGLFLLCSGILQAHLVGSRSDSLDQSSTKLLFDTASSWARHQGARTLHLGGGVGAQEDSLFFFKTGFSDQRHDFALWHWVLFPDVVDRLCQEKEEWTRRNGMESPCAPYYPMYRCPNCPCINQQTAASWSEQHHHHSIPCGR